MTAQNPAIIYSFASSLSFSGYLPQSLRSLKFKKIKKKVPMKIKKKCHFSFFLMKYRLRMNESIWIEWDPLEQISVVGIVPLKVV